MADISKSDLRSYSMLAFPLAVAGLPLYLHAPDFYVTEFGIQLSHIGLILLFIRVLDAVQDPFIGMVSDRYRQARLGIMTVAIAGLAAGMVCLFMPPERFTTLWFAAWVVVSTTCFSILTINLNAIGGIWSDNSHQKTVIASSRERLGLFGVLTGVMVPGLLVIWYSKSFSFALFSILLTCVLVYCGWRFRAWAKENPRLFASDSGATTRLSPARMPSDPAIIRLIALTFPGAVASSLPAVLLLFFVRDVLDAESMVWLFLMIYFLSAVAGIPVWRNLSARIGKVRTWSISIAMAIVSFVAAAFVTEGLIPLYMAVCVFTGLALGGDLVFPASLMADIVDKNEHSRGRAGLGYAWLSFIQKAGLGLAAGIAFPVLDRLGYVTGEDNGATALFGLVFLYAILPLFLKGISLWMLWVWRRDLEGDLTYEKEINNSLFGAARSGADSNRM